jgi:hypothetical protein
MKNNNKFHFSCSYRHIVNFLGDEKQRTLSGKRRKSKGKVGLSRESSYDNSESFSKAREPKRIESVDIPDDDTDYEKSVKNNSTTNIGLDQVPINISFRFIVMRNFISKTLRSIL